MAERPSKITDDALLAAVPGAANLRQLLQAVGVAAYGANYELVRERLRRLDVDEPRFRSRRRTPPVAPAALRAVVARSDTWAQAARELGLRGSSGERRVRHLAGVRGPGPEPEAHADVGRSHRRLLAILRGSA